MATTEVIEGEVVESTALAHRNGAALTEWTPRFAITVDQAVEIVEQKREFMDRVMRKDEHYGVIPGTGTKPSLLKSGAELLLSSMGLHPRYRDTAPAIEDWTGADHNGEAFFRYRKTCMITRSTGPGPEDYVVIAEAGGNCNSWEKKYRYRAAERSCPSCGEHTIIKGKAEFGGGWLCWKKKGGCGEKFEDNDTRITKQEAGQVANPDIADLANTLEKMADKRALVAATLLATGCSDIFTQDLEDRVDTGDMNGFSNGEAEHGSGAPQPAAPKQRNRKPSSPPAAAKTPPPADPEPTGEIGQMAALYELAAALPSTPQNKQQVDYLVSQHGFGTILTRLTNGHHLQCGSRCEHLAPAELPV